MVRAKRTSAALRAVAPANLRLDFGCGPHKRENFTGVDRTAFVGVDVVLEIANDPWPWADGSVIEAHASHFLEHLTSFQRMHFCNELYRVLVPNGTCQVIVPHWASCRAYGDPTHQWPPVSEFWFYYLSREWRIANAPHSDVSVLPGGYACHFEATWGYSLRADLLMRNVVYQQAALAEQKEAAQDIIATLKAVK